MCDYWRVEKRTTLDAGLVHDVIISQCDQGLKKVYFTGGECLLEADRLFPLVERLRAERPGIDFCLNTNGILLERHSRDVARLFSKVIVSLDAVSAEMYREIRGVDALDRVCAGLYELRHTGPKTRINLRALVLPANMEALPDLIDCARRLRVDRISFLPEDTRSVSAFGRTGSAGREQRFPGEALSRLREIIDAIRLNFACESGRLLAKDCEDLQRVCDYYAGSPGNHLCTKAAESCVISVNGAVNPCYFIESGCHISASRDLEAVLGSPEYEAGAGLAGRGLHPACRWCVCPKELT